jgi:mono-ADP-ribosyltransferase sirtuin 6
MTNLEQRIKTLVQWMFEAKHLVVFTGAGISTESGLPDFRGPDGIWTRQAKGLPIPKFDWDNIKPNQNHLALVELQKMGKLAFLISQNVDNLHLESGIKEELLAELHGNRFKLRCISCQRKWYNYPDLKDCPECGSRLVSSVVNFGDSLPIEDWQKSEYHSRQSDLFIVIGSSLVVYPAANCPKIALDSGAKLVIINEGDTPFDRICHLRFKERISKVLPTAISQLKEMIRLFEGDKGR